MRDWFARVNEYAEQKGLVCEHYIISSGLKEIIEGTEIAGEFKEIYAAEYLYGENKLAKWPAMAVNFSSKTQFLYRVNKGVPDVTDQHSLNKFVPEEDRRVPFSNMVYIGDGDTDVPCMKLTKVNGGHSIAVYQKGSSKEARKLIKEDRVDFALPADYRSGKSLEQAVFTIIDEVAAAEHLKVIRKKHEQKL